MKKYFNKQERTAHDGSSIVRNFVSREVGHRDPGIEDRQRKLEDLIGRIADAAGLNLLDFIDVSELRGLWTHHPEGIESDWTR